MVLCSLFAALTGICAWISIPLPPIAFTLQTFAVFLALGVLGGKWGTVSILLYLLLGAVGLPVFTGFRGGISALLDPTGGFLLGFGLAGLVYWALERLNRTAAMLCGLFSCYLCGCLWFSHYAQTGLWAAALTCVVPFLLPDLGKLWLAKTLSRRLRAQRNY